MAKLEPIKLRVNVERSIDGVRVVFPVRRHLLEEDRAPHPLFERAVDRGRSLTDPRRTPDCDDMLRRWGLGIAAAREACAGCAITLTFDWANAELRAECLVPKHLDVHDFAAAVRLRMAVIERRLGLLPADEAADEAAVAMLKTLLPPPPATEA